MKISFDLIVVIPVGPGSKLGYVLDTMESTLHYTSGSLKFIIIDDSQIGTATAIKAQFQDIDVLTIPNNLGKVGGLYISLSDAYGHAIEHYNFDLLLRMDDDALLIGPDPHLDALELLREWPNTGIIGRHIKGRLSADSFGNVHDNYWPIKQLIKDTSTWKAFRRPVANLALRNLLRNALGNGYDLGENIQGGAYFISRRCIEGLAKAGLLPMRRLKMANLCEDHLFSLLTKAISMELQDFAGPNQPFGITWKGLPASPGQLMESGKKIIHSLRYWQDMDEKGIRYYFKQQRSREQNPKYQNEVKICG